MKNGEWKVYGHLASDEIEGFGVPEFARKMSDGSVLISRYDDKLKFISERRGAENDLARMPRDALMGYGSVEIALTEALGQNH